MKTARLGGTGIELTMVGFGGSVLGNLYREVSDEVAQDAVDAAWSNGIRYFDTAPHYGIGLSERRLGRALAGRPREQWVLSTKVGRLLVPNEQPVGSDPYGFAVLDVLRREWDFSRDGVLRSVEESLLRLGTDRIDILYIHDPDDHVEQALAGAAPALTELRAQGVIKAWGVGMNRSDIPTRFVRETDLDVVMLAGRFTLLEQGAADVLLPLCLERGVSVVDVGVFNSGLLSKPRPMAGARYDYAEAPPALVARANEIADVCESFGLDLPTVALAFPFTHPAVAAVAVGLRDRRQVESTVAMLHKAVPDEVWIELAHRQLIRKWCRCQ